MATFKAILRDWVNEGFDPFAAPVETGTAFGPKQGDNIDAIERTRIATRRMPGLPGDSPLRDDMPVNRAFADVSQDEPEIHAEPGFEGQLHAFSLFKYLSRSDVTWNPSVTAVCKASLACPTTEEFILPVFHGNDRVEWFIQLSDEIVWDVGDKNTGAPRARVTMKAGTSPPCRPTSVIKATRPSARCSMSGRTSRLACRSAMKAASCRLIRSISRHESLRLRPARLSKSGRQDDGRPR